MKISIFNRILVTLLLVTSIHHSMLAQAKLPISIGFSNQYTLSYDLNMAMRELDGPTKKSFDAMDVQALGQSISRMFHNLQVVQTEYNRAEGEQLKKEFREAIKELQLRLIYAQNRYDNLARQVTQPKKVVEQEPIEYAPVETRKGRQPMAITHEGTRNPFALYDTMSRGQLESEIEGLQLKVNGSRLAFKRDATRENREILKAWENELAYVQN